MYTYTFGIVNAASGPCCLKTILVLVHAEHVQHDPMPVHTRTCLWLVGLHQVKMKEVVDSRATPYSVQAIDSCTSFWIKT